jgi:hypothetical protein
MYRSKIFGEVTINELLECLSRAACILMLIRDFHDVVSKERLSGLPVYTLSLQRKQIFTVLCETPMH